MKKRQLISLLRSGRQKIKKKVQGDPWRRRDILFDQYRVVVGGMGIVYEGDSVSEAKRQFRLFLGKSKAAKSGSAGEPVTLFKNYDIIRDYPAQ